MKRKYEKPTMEVIALGIVVMFEQSIGEAKEIGGNVVFDSKENDFSFSNDIEEDDQEAEEEI